MPDSVTGLLDPTRILFDLQQGNEIAQGFSGCMEPEEIARRVTDGLVKQFDCAFARIWLLEPDQTTLKLDLLPPRLGGRGGKTMVFA